jgi:hypothetical protein
MGGHFSTIEQGKPILLKYWMALARVPMGSINIGLLCMSPSAVSGRITGSCYLDRLLPLS